MYIVWKVLNLNYYGLYIWISGVSDNDEKIVIAGINLKLDQI